MDVDVKELLKSLMVGFAILFVIGTLCVLFPFFMIILIMVLLTSAAAALLGLTSLQMWDSFNGR